MSTRCQIFIKECGEPVVTMYRHYDGYPTGMGQELVQMLTKCETAQELTVMLLTAWNFQVELEPINAKHGDTEYEYTVEFNNGWGGSGGAPTLTVRDLWANENLTIECSSKMAPYYAAGLLEDLQRKHCH